MSELKRGQFLDETGQPALWISWSRLLTFEKCQQRLAFQMDGKGDVIKEGRNFVSGTVADRAMRQWLDQDTPQLPGQMASYIEDDLWQRYTKDETEYKITFKKDDPIADENRAKELALEAVNAIEPFLLAKVIPLEYQPEWRFKVVLKLPDDVRGISRSVVLNGGADIVVRNPETGELFIYDLKVTRNENYIKGPVLSQLTFYQIVAHYLVGTEYDLITPAFLTPACKTQYHGLTIGPQDRRHLMTRIAKLATHIWNNEVPELTPDVNECYFCSCKAVCDRFATVKVPGTHRVSIMETARVQSENKAPNQK